MYLLREQVSLSSNSGSGAGRMPRLREEAHGRTSQNSTFGGVMEITKVHPCRGDAFLEEIDEVPDVTKAGFGTNGGIKEINKKTPFRFKVAALGAPALTPRGLEDGNSLKA